MFKASSTVLVRFPFSDIASSKQRPALVLTSIQTSKRTGIVVVAMITSQIRSNAISGDVILNDWEKAGLLHPSKLRLAKIATLDVTLIQKPLGRLSKADMKQARAAFRNVFDSIL